MKYWILTTRRSDSRESLIKYSPEIFKEKNWEFDIGDVFIHKIPKIHYKLDHEIGILQDCLCAPGLDGLVVNRRLREVFEALGLENLQMFPIDIELVTGEVYEYFIINIVGKYDIVDYGKSDVEMDYDFGGVESYNSLIFLDTEEMVLPSIFRWSEYLTVIIASDSVKMAVEAGGFTGIRFIEPEKYGALRTIL